MLRKNVIATSGKAIEAAGDTDVLLLDKTGTITLGNRMATEFIPAEGFTVEQLADAAQLASLADETPEGRSIVVLAKEKFNIRAGKCSQLNATFIPFTAQTRMSGIDLKTDGWYNCEEYEKAHQMPSELLFKTIMDFFLRKSKNIVSGSGTAGSNTTGCCRK